MVRKIGLAMTLAVLATLLLPAASNAGTQSGLDVSAGCNADLEYELTWSFTNGAGSAATLSNEIIQPPTVTQFNWSSNPVPSGDTASMVTTIGANFQGNPVSLLVDATVGQSTNQYGASVDLDFDCGGGGTTTTTVAPTTTTTTASVISVDETCLAYDLVDLELNTMIDVLDPAQLEAQWTALVVTLFDGAAVAPAEIAGDWLIVADAALEVDLILASAGYDLTALTQAELDAIDAVLTNGLVDNAAAAIDAWAAANCVTPVTPVAPIVPVTPTFTG